MSQALPATSQARTASRVSQRLFDIVDISATVVFSIQGAAAAAVAGFDLLGVLVVGFAVGLGGGVIRDVLLGDLPPAAFRSPSRMIGALLAALATFLLLLSFPTLSSESLVYLDAIGLASLPSQAPRKPLSMAATCWWSRSWGQSRQPAVA